LESLYEIIPDSSRIKSGMTAFMVVEIKVTLKAEPEKLRRYNTFKPLTYIFPGEQCAQAGRASS
jgi:hypothetical protein